MPRVEHFQADVRVGGGELRGISRRHYVILRAVKDQGGLAEIVMISDSDIVLRPGVLQEAIDALSAPRLHRSP